MRDPFAVIILQIDIPNVVKLEAVGFAKRNRYARSYDEKNTNFARELCYARAMKDAFQQLKSKRKLVKVKKLFMYETEGVWN